MPQMGDLFRISTSHEALTGVRVYVWWEVLRPIGVFMCGGAGHTNTTQCQAPPVKLCCCPIALVQRTLD
jgi:hypothetical protein